MRIQLNFVFFVLSLNTLFGVSDCRQCVHKAPLTVQPACPRSQSNINENRCDSLDAKCCWNSTSDGSLYPKCYYSPDKPVYNVALGRRTFMKNTLNNDKRVISSKGVDGCTNNNLWGGGCCFHTADHRDTWWTVDLEAQYLIESVTLTTRNSHAYTRDFKIELSNVSHDPYSLLNREPGALTVCANHPQAVPVSTTERIPCLIITAARYVIIHKITKGKPALFLCEVQVETVGRFNAALGKVVTLSSTYKSGNIAFNGFKAVDGCFGESYTTSCCAHTNFKNMNHWLLVDLGETYTVYSVTIVNGRDGSSTLINLEIILSNDTSNFSVPCVEAIPYIGITETRNIKCSNPITARYVRVLRQITWRSALYFCEIEVEAKCRYDRYGGNCWYECHCNNQVACDLVSGLCPNGSCVAGFNGSKCDIPCKDGTYGKNCLNNCSANCRNNIACAADSGNCPQGCKDGYVAPLCDTVCPNRTYGKNCSESCSGNCLNNEVCHHIDGNCSLGCAAGYQGPRCIISCSDGFYGENCANNCSNNCLNTSVCDRVTGECPLGCTDGYQEPTCKQKVLMTGKTNESGTHEKITGVAVGVALGVLLAIGVILIFTFIYIRRKKTKQKKQEHGQVVIENHSTMLDLLKDASAEDHHPNNIINNEAVDHNETENNKTLPKKPTLPVKPVLNEECSYENVPQTKSNKSTWVKKEEFDRYVTQMKTSGGYDSEYTSIPNSVLPVAYAENVDLKIKNRYKNILPYDKTRVVLETVGDDPLSDYINANHIMDYKGQRSYVAALGTTEHTINDFWRMIWNMKVELIVMVTKLMEEQKLKCVQYWPDKTHQTYGNVQVNVESVQPYPHYVHRVFEVKQGNEKRKLKHYQYTEWPDKGVPQNVTSLYQLRELMRQHRNTQQSPILVHCSAGVGRTGTLIALDILLDQAEAEGAVDVYNCVCTLRQQRMHMVQTIGQYKFIHDFLHEILTVGVTLLPCADVANQFENEKRKLCTQYQLLEHIKPVVEVDIEQIKNTDKNRDNKVVPSDAQRAKLTSDPDLYFNAVFIGGYKKKLEFLVTQVPLENTAEDFWKFIFEENSTSIVCLQNDPKYSDWIPEDKPLQLGMYSVEVERSSSKDGILQKDVKVQIMNGAEYTNVPNEDTSSNPPHHARMFLLSVWADKAVSDRNRSTMIDLYGAVQKWQQQKGNKLVTVVCVNGAEESGLYVALSQLFDMANVEQQVDVYQAVKQLRKTRPQFISSVSQYLFLYEALKEYISGFDEYSNFRDVNV